MPEEILEDSDIPNSNRITTYSQKSSHDSNCLGDTKATRKKWHPPSRSSQYIGETCQRTGERCRWENPQACRRVSQVQGWEGMGGGMCQFFTVSPRSFQAGRKHLGGDGIRVGRSGPGRMRQAERRLGCQSKKCSPTPILTPCFASNFRGDYQPSAVPWTAGSPQTWGWDALR